MDAALFAGLVAVSAGAFYGGYRAVVDRPPYALVFGVLALLATTVLVASVVSDPDGVTLQTVQSGAYTYTLAAELSGPPPPAFDFTFDSAGDLSGWLQSRYVYPQSGGTRYGWTADHGGAIQVESDDSRGQRFDGLYVRVVREAGQEWSTLEFDYRLVGLPGRHGLSVGWSCDACFTSNNNAIVAPADAPADTGWRHVQLTIPIVEKDLQITFFPPIISAGSDGLYSPRLIQLDNVEIDATGVQLSTSTVVGPGVHETSVDRWVLTADTRTETVQVLEATAQNRTVLGGLLSAWAVVQLVTVVGWLAPVLGGGRK